MTESQRQTRALARLEQGVRCAPYQALQEQLAELDAYSHTIMLQWPKVERHLLCAQVRDTLLRIRRHAAVAWKRRQKIAALFELDVEIEVLRHLVRKAFEMRYINGRRLAVWSQHINEVGCMVGAWIKHAQTSNQ
jgi:hypothetical protein